MGKKRPPISQIQVSSVSKEIVECLLTLLEGRRDRVVHGRVLSVLQVSMLKHRLDMLKKLLAYSVRDQEELLSEGVEIMNALLSLATVDEDLKDELKSEDEVYDHFYEKMGHVEIKFKACCMVLFGAKNVPKLCHIATKSYVE